MKGIKNLILVSLFFSCTSNRLASNTDEVIFVDNKFRMETSIKNNMLNYNLFYHNEYLLNIKINTSPEQMVIYQKIISDLSSHIASDSTDIIFKTKEKIYYLNNDEFIKTSFLNFEKANNLQEKFNDAVLIKIDSLIINSEYEKAYRVAEMSVYLRTPLYYGVIKDDRSLKILIQQELFNMGKKQEAINNLLNL